MTFNYDSCSNSSVIYYACDLGLEFQYRWSRGFSHDSCFLNFISRNLMFQLPSFLIIWDNGAAIMCCDSEAEVR